MPLGPRLTNKQAQTYKNQIGRLLTVDYFPPRGLRLLRAWNIWAGTPSFANGKFNKHTRFLQTSADTYPELKRYFGHHLKCYRPVCIIPPQPTDPKWRAVIEEYESEYQI